MPPETIREMVQRLRDAERVRSQQPLVVPEFYLKKLGLKWRPDLTVEEIYRAAAAYDKKRKQK